MLFQSSFEEILYIVIGIVWIGYSIYKGTQKSKANRVKTTGDDDQEPDKKSVFETFIDNIVEEEKPLPYTRNEYETFDDEAIAEQPAKQEEVFSYDDYYEEGNFESVADVYADRMEKRNETLRPSRKEKKYNIPKKKKPRIDLKKLLFIQRY